MTRFADVLAEHPAKLECFDRIIFKGHLTRLYWAGGFLGFLCALRVRLTDFGKFVEQGTERVIQHAKDFAKKAGRPYLYIDHAMTWKTGGTKEQYAREIAERDGIDQGLIAVFATLEMGLSFTVRGNRATHQLEVVPKRRRCRFLYFYLIDPEFGFMHVRLQSWFPFEMQVYINGHEWLARQLDRLGIAYTRHHNTFSCIEDLARANSLCERFCHRKWARVLDAFARRFNIMLPTVKKARYGDYYWGIDQAEFSTDMLFVSRKQLEGILPDVFEHALVHTGAKDVLKFLDRKLNGHFMGEVTTRIKHRPECVRLRHFMKRNSIKMYDKGPVLRVETTINNPSEFKVLKSTRKQANGSRRWRPMGKGVANFWRYAQVARQANSRYIDAISSAPIKREAVDFLDRLCRSTTRNGVRFAGFKPLSKDDHALFTAVLSGEYAINGFRNRDIQARLYPFPTRDPQAARRRCGRVSRLLRKLRAHRLIGKVQGARLYRVTRLGHAVLGAAVRLRTVDYPAHIRASA